MLLSTLYYPITGPLRLILIVMEGIICGIALEFAFLFYIRVKREKNKLKTIQEKAYIWIFLGYSSVWFIFLLTDYYIDPSIRLMILNFGYFSLMFFAGVFIYYIEKIKIFYKKYFFTTIFAVMILLYIFLMIYSIDIATLLSHAMWPVFLCFFVFYLRELRKDFYVKKSLREFNINFLKFIIGVFFLVSGYQLTLGWALRTFGLYIRFIGDVFQLIGLFFLLLFFISVPSFSEYDWKDKIESIYIINKGGIFLYKRFFREKEENLDPNIVTGTLTSIKLMLEKMTDRKGVSIIEREEGIILYYPGDKLTVVMFCDEKLISLQILTESFLEKIETVYANVMDTWKGDTNIFLPIENIIKEFFY